jgi:hypothetical protein
MKDNNIDNDITASKIKIKITLHVHNNIKVIENIRIQTWHLKIKIKINLK